MHNYGCVCMLADHTQVCSVAYELAVCFITVLYVNVLLYNRLFSRDKIFPALLVH